MAEKRKIDFDSHFDGEKQKEEIDFPSGDGKKSGNKHGGGKHGNKKHKSFDIDKKKKFKNKNK